MSQLNPGNIKDLSSITNDISDIKNTLNTLLNNNTVVTNTPSNPTLNRLNNLVNQTQQQIQIKNTSQQTQAQNNITTIINSFVNELQKVFTSINMENVFTVIEKVVMWVETNFNTILQYANYGIEILQNLSKSDYKLQLALTVCQQVISFLEEDHLISAINYIVSKIYPHNTTTTNTTAMAKPKAKRKNTLKSLFSSLV